MSNESTAQQVVCSLGRVLDFRGRSAPGDFWPYILSLGAVYLIALLVAASQPLVAGLPLDILFGATGVLILLATAAVVRRLHDVSASGLWMTSYTIVTIILIAYYFDYHYHLLPDDLDDLSLISFVAVVMMFVFPFQGIVLLILCALPGTAGPNRYGADPTEGSGR